MRLSILPCEEEICRLRSSVGLLSERIRRPLPYAKCATFPPQMVSEMLRVYVRMHERMWYRFPRNSYLMVDTAFALRRLLHFRRQSERERLARVYARTRMQKDHASPRQKGQCRKSHSYALG